MRVNLLALFVLVLFASSCNNNAKSPRPGDAIGVGREFIEASLKGRYDDAKRYLLPDSLNLMYFERMQGFYQKMSASEKQGYKEANIIINDAEEISDSLTILNYSNTFKKEPAKIKLVRIASEWWVDFKYSFSGNL